MAGGIWLGQVGDAEDERSVLRPGFTESGSDEADGTPRTTSP